ncbi:MAG: glycosyltransferase [Thiobacillaceae bacterium]
MRILMLSDVYFPRVNGVSTSIQMLRRALHVCGVETVLVAPRYNDEAEEPDLWRVPGVRVPRDPEDRLMGPRVLWARLKRIQPGEFDLIHIHTPFFAHLAGVRLAEKLGIPCVETYHTLFEEYFYHYLPFLPKSWLKSLARVISKKECNRVSGVVAPSTPMLQALRAYGVEVPITVLPTGLERADFSTCDGGAFRQRMGIAPERSVMLYVGRVAFEKNLDFLLDMMEPLRSQQPDALLLIAGEGPARKALQREVNRRGLQEQVRFIGYLDRRRELPDCYCAANVFVFASRTETQGLVLLEAMLLGIPVVALAEMGTRDVLQEGEGCRIAPDDPAGFAAAVAAVLDDPAAAQVLGERGRAYAARWTAEVMAGRMVQLYQSMMQPGHGHAATTVPGVETCGN